MGRTLIFTTGGRDMTAAATAGRGGYDEGYRACSSFWGTEPGSLVRRYLDGRSLSGLRVLDVGCGDGKNAIWLAARGADVRAVDVSEAALARALEHPGAQRVRWELGDACSLAVRPGSYDVIVAYGVFHCLPSQASVTACIELLKTASAPGCLHLVATFDDGPHDMTRAHPGFQPTLLPHSLYANAYSDWNLLEQSSARLNETHPHNGVPHFHSLTRLAARRSA